MDEINADHKTRREVQPRISVIPDVSSSEGTNEPACRLAIRQEVINEPGSIESRIVEEPTETTVEKGVEESPELTRKMSKSEAVKQDAMKLKAATLGRLGRMGKMFKQRSETLSAAKPSLGEDGIPANPIEKSQDVLSSKEKTNSLGRMLKLVDKDGSPKKLFVRSRAGSLSRILRRHPQNNDELVNKTVEGSAPGIFSRMFHQIRGRPKSGSAAAEPNLQMREKMCPLPPKVPVNSPHSSI